jgi:hypothetical protein
VSINSFYKFGDVGSYLVDFKAEINHGDRYVFIYIKTDKVTIPSFVIPSHKSSYVKAKVIWYHEKLGTANTVVYEDAETVLTQLLVDELTREIDQQIMADLVAMQDRTNYLNERL